MATNSSSTVAVTSEVCGLIEKALRQATKELSKDRSERIQMLRTQLLGLERRGFLKRQRYTSTTSVEFERKFSSLASGLQVASVNKESQSAQRNILP